MWTLPCALVATLGCHLAIGLGEYEQTGGAGGTAGLGGAGIGGMGAMGGDGGAGGAGGSTDDFLVNWAGRVSLEVTTSVSAAVTDIYVPLSFEVPVGAHDLLSDQSSGGDFRVTLAGSTDPLPVDVERYLGGSRQLVIWVRLPEIQPGTDPIFLNLYFGNENADHNRSWPDHEGVYHLSGAVVSQNRRDSSGNDRHTNNPTSGWSNVNNGLMGGALGLMGTAEATIPDMTDALAFSTETFTVSAWLRPTLSSGKRECAVFRGGTDAEGTATPGYALGLAGSNAAFFYTDTAPTPAEAEVIMGALGSEYEQVVAVVDKQAEVVSLYRNGQLEGTTSIVGFGETDDTEELSLGSDTCPYAGTLDEVRFVSRALTLEEIRGNYEVISSPPVVESVGPLELAP